MKRAYGYTRSATGETSHIQIQQIRIRDYCKKNKLKLIGFLDDNQASGSNAFQNTAFNELLFKIGKMNKIDAVVVADNDRLARNAEDYLLIKQLFERKEVELIVINNHDLSDLLSPTPMDAFMNEVMEALQTFEKRIVKKHKLKYL